MCVYVCVSVYIYIYIYIYFSSQQLQYRISFFFAWLGCDTFFASSLPLFPSYLTCYFKKKKMPVNKSEIQTKFLSTCLWLALGFLVVTALIVFLVYSTTSICYAVFMLQILHSCCKYKASQNMVLSFNGLSLLGWDRHVNRGCTQIEVQISQKFITTVKHLPGWKYQEII